MSYNPDLDKDIRIVWSTEELGFVLQLALIKIVGGETHIQVSDGTYEAPGTEYWYTLTPGLDLLNAVYQAFDYMYEDNHRLREIDLGPLDSNGPEAELVRQILAFVQL